jgi:hypothetical protein
MPETIYGRPYMAAAFFGWNRTCGSRITGICLQMR